MNERVAGDQGETKDEDEEREKPSFPPPIQRNEREERGNQRR